MTRWFMNGVIYNTRQYKITVTGWLSQTELCTGDTVLFLKCVFGSTLPMDSQYCHYCWRAAASVEWGVLSSRMVMDHSQAENNPVISENCSSTFCKFCFSMKCKLRVDSWKSFYVLQVPNCHAEDCSYYRSSEIVTNFWALMLLVASNKRYSVQTSVLN